METLLSLQDYAEQIGVSENEIKGQSRKYEHKIPRHLYWLYLNQNGINKRTIARMFGKVHSTIINGINTITNLIDTNDTILDDYDEFISTFLPQNN